MTLLLRISLLATELILFISFIYVILRWFKKVEQTKRWELYLIKYAGLIFVAFHLIAASTADLQNKIFYVIGMLLLSLSAVLFFWAINVFKSQPPAIAFSDEIVSPLQTKGPYQFIRHPFYTAYSLAWLGGTFATCNWWLLISVIVMGYVYYKAAKEEEKLWLSGTHKEEYIEYKNQAGMLFPKI